MKRSVAILSRRRLDCRTNLLSRKPLLSHTASCLTRILPTTTTSAKVLPTCRLFSTARISPKKGYEYFVKGINKEIADSEKTLTLMRQVINLVSMDATIDPSMTLLKALASRFVPPIHEELDEYIQTLFRDSPKETRVLAKKLLYHSYLNASSRPWVECFMLLEGKNLPVDNEQLMKRWHGNAALALLPQLQPSPGDIVDVDKHMPDLPRQYGDEIRSLFINAPCNPLTKFEDDSTHVSVGFNDLNEIAMMASSASRLRYVGIDKSAVAVARSLILKEMLEDPVVPLDTIVQVWYSSSWTKDTLSHFREACRKVVEVCHGENSTMDAILFCWLYDQPITSTESRQKWFEHLSSSETGSTLTQAACSFHRKKDRMAILKYILSGEVIERAPEYGNVMFWNTPPEFSMEMEQDSLFNTVSMDVVQSLVAKDEEQSYLLALVAQKMAELGTLRSRLLSGSIEIDLRVGTVNLDETMLLKNVLNLNPTTMSWSNVVDHCGYEDFHILAKQFKVKRHYGYTMNWVTMVFGTSLIDYFPLEEGFFGQQLMKRSFIIREHPLLTKPSFIPPQIEVEMAFAADMKDKWLSYFASEGSATIIADHMMAETLLQRSRSSIYFAWEYEGAK